MKKLLIAGWVSMLMVVGLGGCVEDSTPPSEGSPALGGAPLSPEQRANIEASPEFQEAQRQLERHGEAASLDEAQVFQRGDKVGVVCPVTGPEGEQGEFSQLTYQQIGGEAPTLSLEDSGRSPLTGARKDEALEASGITCSAWGPWSTRSTYCDWATACWFGDATYLLRERARTCCAPGYCYGETEHTTVRNKCGC